MVEEVVGNGGEEVVRHSGDLLSFNVVRNYMYNTIWGGICQGAGENKLSVKQIHIKDWDCFSNPNPYNPYRDCIPCHHQCRAARLLPCLR